jgi:hypothetical protein
MRKLLDACLCQFEENRFLAESVDLVHRDGDVVFQQMAFLQYDG